MARSFLAAILRLLVVLHSIGVSMPNDLFQKLIPEFIFCFDFTNLRSNEELLKIMVNFPVNVKTRQQKCFLRCLLRRHRVFLDPSGTQWNWEEAFEFLMSFGYSAGREPYVKSSLFFCVRKKKELLSKYGCKNAYNFFMCLIRHGMTFKSDRWFWDFRKKYLLENPYVYRDKNVTMSGNVTDPIRKSRPNATLENVQFDDGAHGLDDRYDTTLTTPDLHGARLLHGPPDVPFMDEVVEDGIEKRETITVTIPDVASHANKLTNLKWVYMTNSD